jgi:hypothetical protein
MFYQNDYITQIIKKQQANEYLRQAEQDRLLAGLDPQRTSRLFQLARGTLHATGHLLLTIGRRLDQIEAPKTQVRIGHTATSK